MYLQKLTNNIYVQNMRPSHNSSGYMYIHMYIYTAR